MTTEVTSPSPGSNSSQWLDWTTLQQSTASHPERSAWVSANAGSGKTHVLTQRVIRLLLAGARPSSILCLTYTKAAASEMSNRVFDRLAAWVTLTDEELAKRIYQIERIEPDRETLAKARRLFARALETPGGLKIQTIHAFCEALLHQFPLEANVAGHFSVLDDRAATAVLAEARRSLLTATSSEDNEELAEAFAEVLSIADDTGLEVLLSDIVANRLAIRRFRAAAERQGGMEQVLRKRLSLSEEETEESIAASGWPMAGLAGSELTQYIELAAEKAGEKVRAIADALALANAEENPLLRFRHLETAFLTASEAPKADSTLIAAAMTKVAPALKDAVIAARDHFVIIRDRLRIFRMYKATRTALVLATRLDEDYEALKKRRSQLDFEDLIARTADLLMRADVGAWVHYKLDQGIDHILVDEAQDTSPVQWSVIRSLREDFFVGEGARDSLRTFFAVGDEKQSIYSFQGARPERFSLEAGETAKAVAQGGQLFSSIRLPLSFRSTATVLSAVDQVFSVPDNARGLSPSGDQIEHMSNRTGHPGTVDVWDLIIAEKQVRDEDWTAPFDSTPESAPSAILARRMAYRIGEMIGRETVIEDGKERPIRPGDILVLVRKRDSFVNALTRALKRNGNIPVAGADRLKLTSHIAVQDLLALGRFVLLPADDLSLAALLKSPLFNHSEDQLFELAAYRKRDESLWVRLQNMKDKSGSNWTKTVQTLELFLSMAARYSAHDFYARVLGVHGGRKAYLARLGGEVSDILDEFLTFALSFETASLPGLQAFVSTLELEAPEVKREQDKERDEVRIMTVHASKGLEAPVVFLVDGGSKAFNHSHLSKLRLLDDRPDRLALPVWLPSKALSNSVIEEDTAARQIATEEEYRRLLYVAMTRAADRLVICGYRGVQDTGEIWHRMVSTALSKDESRCKPAEFSGPDGSWTGLSWRIEDPVKVLPAEDRAESASKCQTLPASLLEALPPTRALPRPLSPSGAGSLIIEDEDEVVTASALFDRSTSGEIALQRGRLIHRMLQSLPGVPPADRAKAAERYAERAAGAWSAGERQGLVESVLSVLDHPDLADVFGAKSKAEVSIMGTMSLRGELRAVSGRIDRLAVLDRRILVLDYKTNRQVPATETEVPLAHRAQLAIYREILKPLYPDSAIHCMLVYTENGSVIPLSDAVLCQSLADLETS
ncbi:double-strand break repair helicase AddA [Peteryoungia desertarenae]|uniref:DNA 3'-5' helicase n=1 Tax=Peteryoungia desertarenae TaxID=1813451 RepID=A0ABX6QJZ6_9HYPH|nr:double-strand break repair helicase AddA [Peteryoungia desertarenae]QLF68878.1 double-strand break repair helicase AddA [Peteryoungia desertarenae]